MRAPSRPSGWGRIAWWALARRASRTSRTARLLLCLGGLPGERGKRLTAEDVQRLEALGLLSGRPLSGPTPALAGLCAEGILAGGVSVAADVRPDELLGPLCQRIGGPARGLRVLDVRQSPPELWVRSAEVEERWATKDVAALVRALNRFYRGAPAVRAIALLGTWDGACQLWCLPKETLSTLLVEGILEAENLDELRALVAS